MYYDLIYTRCRHGIDLLRSGQPILSDGFKVYACSSDLYKDSLVDLQLTMNFVQKKQSFSEPDFMEDAYLYAVPDTGLRLLNSFHPVPYDLSVTGDFAKRPGMYLNHTIAGDFEDIYPFEAFHDASIWTARDKNEAYYYEQEPIDIPPREKLTEGTGYYDFTNVGAFIQDGRRDALKKAVSFILSQLACPPDERKYLVIRDESSENIEMWIAAIELAFSPRIAANISFATRMDKYAGSNIYYVNNDGMFSQPQQDSANNHVRLRAMIIGVVTKDKANSVRKLDEVPYSVLDGVKKEALFEGDVSGSYYDLISSFDEIHERFSREFLQSMDLTDPCGRLKLLADAFETLCGASSGSPAEYAAALESLSSYKLYRTDIICEIYEEVNKRTEQFLRSSPEKSLPIFNWIVQTSVVVGDDTAKRRISESLSDRATELFFTAYKKGGFSDFWSNVKEGPFAGNIARLLADDRRPDEYSEIIRSYDPGDAVKFMEIYCDVCRDRLKAGDERAKMLVSYCAASCGRQRKPDSLNEMLSLLTSALDKKPYAFLLDGIKTYEPESLDLVVNQITGNDKAGTGGLDETLALCEALHGFETDNQEMTIIRRYIENANDSMDLELLAGKAGSLECFSDYTRKRIYELLDEKVDVSDAASEMLASSIQENRPENAVCVNSAHLSVLDRLADLKKGDSVGECLEPFTKQEFPSIAQRGYVSRLVSVLLRLELDKDGQVYILDLIASAPEIYGKIYLSELVVNPELCQAKWNSSVAYISECGDAEKRDMLTRALGSALMESGMKKKNIAALGKLLKDNKAGKYYESLADDIADRMKERDGSVVARLFGGFRKQE